MQPNSRSIFCRSAAQHKLQPCADDDVCGQREELLEPFKKQKQKQKQKRQNHLAIAIRMQTVRLAPRFAHARSYPDGPLLLVWCAYGTYLLKLKSPHRMPARRPLALAASKPNDRVELNANASHSCTSEKKTSLPCLGSLAWQLLPGTNSPNRPQSRAM